MYYYDAVENRHGLKHDPFKAIVAPRPIGWISSIDGDGKPNLAPYSFFNGVSDNPHIVMFSSQERKDSVSNIEKTGEFVCNLATWDLRDQMNLSSAMVPADVNEFELAGLTEAACRVVSAPRVAESPIAMECKYLQTVSPTDIGGVDAGVFIVLGQVVGIHIDESCIEDGMLDLPRIRPISRLGYMDYGVVDRQFTMGRPDVENGKIVS